MLADAILILCISVFTALLAEGILKWNISEDLFDFVRLVVYRTDKYKKLAEVEKHGKKCKLETKVSLIKIENLLDGVYDFIYTVERKKETATDTSSGILG